MNVAMHRNGERTKLVFYERREGTTPQPFIAFLNKILLDTLSWVADDRKKSQGESKFIFVKAIGTEKNMYILKNEIISVRDGSIVQTSHGQFSTIVYIRISLLKKTILYNFYYSLIYTKISLACTIMQSSIEWGLQHLSIQHLLLLSICSNTRTTKTAFNSKLEQLAV